MYLYMKYVSLILIIALFALAAERFFLPNTTSDMRENADAYGRLYGKPTPPQPFVYDGCTLFPDTLPGLDLTEACLLHDIAYWYGGEKTERKTVDTRLKGAVASQGIFGQIMQYPVYIGVRLGGDSFLTRIFNANWGFGYNE